MRAALSFWWKLRANCNVNEMNQLPKLAEPERALLRRVLASGGFQRSARLTAFLTYIVEEALAGRGEGITEQQIGIHVFGRPVDYNPAEDNVVRSQARLLRQKLEAYFEEEGAAESIQLQIPKGRYVPVFAKMAEGRPRFVWNRRIIAGVLLACTVVVIGVCIWRMNAGPAQDFWREFFAGTRPVLIVPADSALVLIQDLTKRRVGLSGYLSGEYRQGIETKEGLSVDMQRRIARRRYTGIVDVALASRLVARQAEFGKRPVIRYSRDLSVGELKTAQAILLGAPHANPWLELYRDRLNFWLDLDLQSGEFVVENRKPIAGEASRYETKQADPQRPVYAVIALLPSLDGQGKALILAGASIAGTESAADFLLDDRRFGDFLEKRDGKVAQGFEVLLETRTVAGNSPQAKVLAWRIY
jgi:hypothetical protein